MMRRSNAWFQGWSLRSEYTETAILVKREFDHWFETGMQKDPSLVIRGLNEECPYERGFAAHTLVWKPAMRSLAGRMRRCAKRCSKAAPAGPLLERMR